MFRPLAIALIAVAAAGCATPPSNLDLSLHRPTEAGKYVVALQPPQTPAPLNQIHSWTVKVSTPGGMPIEDARILVDGGMPQHGHGLPTRPQVTRRVGDGAYLMEGVKFSMTGWWQLKFAISAADGADQVTFNTVVRNASAR